VATAAHAEAGEVVSKGEFARLCKVTPGRVSQWLAEGKIGADALDGEGRTAKVKVAVAMAQLRRTLDIGQRFGNGLATQLEFSESAAGADSQGSRPGKAVDPFEVAMRDEKLREIQFRNRAAAEKELASRGMYVLASESRNAMTQLAVGMLNVFDGAMADLAHAVAAKFELPQRDVVHMLRAEFRTIRLKAADQARRIAGDMPPLVLDDVHDD